MCPHSKQYQIRVLRFVTIAEPFLELNIRFHKEPCFESKPKQMIISTKVNLSKLTLAGK